MKAVWFCIALCALVGCRTKKTVTESVRTDTTKTVYDSAAVRAVMTDTTKTDTRGTIYEVVQFVDSGGVILIDSTGHITLQGVSLYKYERAYHQRTMSGVAGATDSSCANRIQENGVQERTMLEQATEQRQTVKWYHTAAIRIVGLCCIAALLYMIFLYVKKKT